MGIQHRRSIRLQGYDYSQPGAHFVTICTQGRECLFGKVVGDTVALTALGLLAQSLWDQIPDHFLDVTLDERGVMPNHMHGILFIGQGRGTACRAPTQESFGAPVVGSLPTIIRSYRAAVTRHARRAGLGSIPWQRGYYEHTLRNESGLRRARDYIVNNPAQWSLDRENPRRRAMA